MHGHSFPLYGFNEAIGFGGPPYSYALTNKTHKHYGYFNFHIYILQVFECKELSLETFTQRKKTQNVIVFAPWKRLVCGLKPS